MCNTCTHGVCKFDDPTYVTSSESHFGHELGLLLRDARRRKGWTQQQLAEQLSTTRASVANLEAGRQRMSAFTLVRVAEALDVPPTDLLPRLSGNPQVHLRERTVRDLPPSHVSLLNRVLASAEREGIPNATSKAKHS